MYDEAFDEVSVFDFDEIAGHLLEQGALASPSRLHGCLCGLLSAGAPAQAEYGLDAVAEALDLIVQGELASRVMQLYTVSQTVLRDDEFSFQPLLPGDDEDLVTRTEALADWCNGFLAGFAYAAAGEDRPGTGLSEQSSEALRDIAALAQADATQDEGDDEAEDNYFELVEYLRVAVINIFLDNDSEAGHQAPSPGERGPLH